MKYDIHPLRNFNTSITTNKQTRGGGCRTVVGTIFYIFMYIILSMILVFSGVSRTASAFIPIASSTTAMTTPSSQQRHDVRSSRLFSLLKPAAIPLMDSGKALARSGELLIELTTSLDIYGGSLSAAGASIRNCGDCIAQAAASCRFKTASELVIDELREGADCLRESSNKFASAIAESEVDNNSAVAILLSSRIKEMIGPTIQAAISLEEAGACAMRQESVVEVGRHLKCCGESLASLASTIRKLDPSIGGGSGVSDGAGSLSATRMDYASEKMMEAGRALTNEVDKRERPTGKSWIKG